MSLSRLRTISLLIAAATLSSNALSSLLFHQLPDDPYHISANFSSYLYFANLVSVLGLLGAFCQHALSVSIFSNYLILDTILCAIPRILILSMLSNIGSSYCVSPDATAVSSLEKDYNQREIGHGEQEVSMGGGIWLESQQCTSIMFLAQAALSVGVIAATLLQFVGALQVREFGRRLAAKAGSAVGGMIHDHVDMEDNHVDMVGGEKPYDYEHEYLLPEAARSGDNSTSHEIEAGSR